MSISIALRRLCAQRITQDQFATPAEVVDWLGAVQAQDYAGAKWSLGLRLLEATDNALDAAFNAGTILRTHVMRPTWHFVTPADIRWLLELTAPRVNAANTGMYRRLELDDALFVLSNAVIVRALETGEYRTRDELAAALAEAGILADGLRLLYIFFRAELDALICSGPRRGKQFTYALLDQRAPRARTLPRDEALAELTRRYYAGHGPATVRDFAWWSGLTVADVKDGLGMAASHLAKEDVDGQTYWFAPTQSGLSDLSDPPESPRTAYLLPTYDEFLIGFSQFDAARRGGQAGGEDPAFTSTILIDGKIAGSWRRSFRGKSVVVDLAPFAPLSPAYQEAVMSAARRFGEFLGMPVELAGP
jgi:hypothetical protein